MHSSKRAQIAYLKVDKAFIKVSSKYTHFADVFLPKLVVKLPKHMMINNHAIEFIDDWQPHYGLIYSLGLMEFEILKTYINNNLVNGFIRSFKFPVGATIFFDNKLNGSLQLYANYWGLNNLTIKNQYPLLWSRNHWIN